MSIFCQVERLGPTYDAGHTHFSLNLSAALSHGTAAQVTADEVRRYLRPWLWRWTDLRVRGIRTGAEGEPTVSEAIDAANVHVIREGLPAAAGALDRLRTKLGEEMDDILRPDTATPNVAPFQWDVADPLPEETVDETRRNWRTFLGHVSTYPGPFPHGITLTVFFRIPNAALNDFDEVVAAPVFTAEPFAAARGPVVPGADELDVDDPDNPLHRVRWVEPPAEGRAPNFYEWRYQDGAAGDIPLVAAYQKECFKTTPAAAEGSRLDLSTLWLAPPAGADPARHDFDWTLQMETRIADAFDLPARLLDAARANLDVLRLQLDPSRPRTPERPLRHIDQTFENLFYASLRDAANYGLAAPPESEGLRPLPCAERPTAIPENTFAEQVLLQMNVSETLRCKLLLRLSQTEAELVTFIHWKNAVNRFIARRERLAADENVLPELPLVVEHQPEFDDEEHRRRFLQDVLTPYQAALIEYVNGLERVYAAFSDEAALVELFMDEWDANFRARNPAADEEVADFLSGERRERLRRVLSGFQVRKRLLVGNMGIAWRTLAGRLDQPAALREQVAESLAAYATGRAGEDVLANLYANYRPRLPAPVAIPPALLNFLRDFGRGFVQERILPKDAPRENADGTAEALVLQLDAVTRKDAGTTTADDQNDEFRRLGGFGVLLRRLDGRRPWSCLNLAQVLVKGEVDDAVRGAIPVPVRLQYRNGVRQVLVSYRNHPLVAESPAADFSQAREMQQLPREAAADGEELPADASWPLLSFRNPYGAGDAAPKLEELLYGKRYEAAVFLLGTASNLPKELCAVDGGRTIPWRFNLPDPFDIPAGAYRQNFDHRRLNEMGPVRLEPPAAAARRAEAQDETGRLDIPAIPPEVRPLARSLAPADRTPLILLAPPEPPPPPPPALAPPPLWGEAARRDFQFVARVPCVDIRIWEAWVGDGSNPRFDLDGRVYVWGKFHELNDAAQGDDKRLMPDATIDDPAVAGLDFRLTRIYPSAPTPPQTVHVPVTQTAGPNGTDLKFVQADGVPVRVESFLPTAPGEETKLTVPDGVRRVDVRVKVGEIWRLEMTPTLSADARDKFHQTLLTTAAKPTVLDIEVAAPFPTDDASRARLHRALRASHVLAPGRDLVRAHLEPVEFKDLIHRVEVLVQRWRWDGRPVQHFLVDERTKKVALDPVTRKPKPPAPGFPFHDVFPDGDLPEHHDGVLFGSRESSDYLLSASQVDFAAPPATTLAQLYEKELTGSPGALYYRFGVRAFSRYAGLMRRDSSLDSRQVPRGQAERWRRLVVKSRYDRDVPRPVVKLIVPLTQAAGGRLTPGLLVVLDEQWHLDSLGGLAERFEAEVVSSARPDIPEESRHEIGPDPILDMSEDPLLGLDVELPPPVGAIGYTFDTDTLAPLFHKAAFIIPPPVLTATEGGGEGGAQERALAYHFLKLRFRRRLDPRGMARPEGLPQPVERQSPWTEPVWAQLLPAANRFRVRRGEAETVADVAAFRFDAEAAGFLDGEGRKVAPLPDGGNDRLKLYVLLTRPVPDAFGREGQESYVGLVEIDKLREVEVEKRRGALARLVEVQYRVPRGKTLGELGDIFELLFPGPEKTAQGTRPRDALARITRISPPIGQ
jgi:hypothetical protein